MRKGIRHIRNGSETAKVKGADQIASHQTATRCAQLATMHTDHPDGTLPAHRRGTLSGMDAAPEPTRTYLRRVLRWWAGKGLAAKPWIVCSAPDLSAWSACIATPRIKQPSLRALASLRRAPSLESKAR
ncbi:hypothetical protein XarjCFBP7645_19875 [Xanthomonas arboricola]|uniref:Uncharacterized protein n=1 Tax=Xanthomonas arboricola TaxID=56448 RepID=A0A2S7A8F5_9XANT|nr:hypothetical protein XarjCFBP7645_19875 [Xanthomonas arboricola]